MKKRSPLLLLLALLLSPLVATGQFLEERAEEDYRHLADSTDLSGWESLKFIPLNSRRTIYFSIGGSFRPRFEYLSNHFWIPGNDDTYYSQKLSLHLALQLGQRLRLFGEWYHGLRSGEEEFLQSDLIDLHQGFVEWSITKSSTWALRLGRQEMKLGAGRLVDLRVGPNIRRSFDLARLLVDQESWSIDAFYGREVQIGFDAFDNRSGLFLEDNTNPDLWGIYGQFSLFADEDVQDNTEIYYLGFRSPQAVFGDAMGEETRHSLGLRRYGTVGNRFRFNTELIFQVGTLADKTIRAFNFETDWKYTFVKGKGRPTIGLKLDWSSGDGQVGDDRLQSFNPMIVNPATYRLAAVNTPINLLSFHPSLTVFPHPKVLLLLDLALFFRANDDDGLYAPPRIQTRPAAGLTARHIGNVIGLFVSYSLNSHWDFDIRTSYFTVGDFVENSGDAEPIFQFASTISLTF